MKRRWVGLLTLTFFLAFPFVGILVFWNDAHRRIQDSARPFAAEAAAAVLAGPTKERLMEMGTLEFRESGTADAAERAAASLGRFQSVKSVRTLKSWAGERGDMVWQFAAAEVTATFANGTGQIDMVVARRTMSPEWRVEKFELRPHLAAR